MTPVNRIRDELLVVQCQQGDARALDRLLQDWQERLWRHAARLAADSEAGWDILQETCLVIARDIRRLSDPAAFPAWAYRIATNKSRDWLRGHQRRRKWEERYAEETLRTTEEDTTLDVRIEGLKEAMSQLEGHDRALLALHYEENFGLGQIAEILGLPQGTVKSRLFHARRRLRAAYERLMEDSDNDRKQPRTR